jgi:glutamate N-acetyltransferase / amino-acid N-acetyltransferase
MGFRSALTAHPMLINQKVNFDPRLVEIVIDLKIGTDSATIKTNDLSHDYVEENSAYST